MKEQELWALVGIKIEKKKSDWYFESGSGMGSSLNLAVNIGAYILSDRSTWISFGNKKNHTIIVENEPLLVNNYGITPNIRGVMFPLVGLVLIILRTIFEGY